MRFEVETIYSWIQGRNGFFIIPQVEFLLFGNDRDGHGVKINGIGQRGKVINGGLGMDAPSFFKGVVAFLEENGYKVTPPCPSN